MENPELQWSGIDTLKLGLGITWTDLTNHQLVINQLTNMQTAARENKPNQWDLMSIPRAVTLPYGRKKYKYSLGNGGTTLFFTEEPEPQENTPNVMMELQPIYCTRRSLEHLHYHLETIINELGAKVSWIKPSELHLTCDIATSRDMQITDFLDHNQAHKYTARARQARYIEIENTTLDEETNETILHGRKTRYFRIGSSDLMLRIYNKTSELKAHPEKAWEAQNWKNPKAPHVTRVEFQIRRQKLHEFEIETLNDLQQKADGTWAYLTKAWFQLQDHPNKGTNWNQPPNEFWQTVISAKPASPPNKPIIKIVPNVQTRINAAMGNLISAYAIAQPERPTDWNDEKAMTDILLNWQEKSPNARNGLWAAIEERQEKLTRLMRNQINADNELTVMVAEGIQNQ